jgi:5-methylcytosine-specific restriction enzyme A
MAFWLFKYRPDRYRLADRMVDPNPVITWTVTRFRNDIRPGDTAFLWETGRRRGIRAVMRVDEPPRDMAELETEQAYWAAPDRDIHAHVVGTLIHRNIDLPVDRIRVVPGLEQLCVFHGIQQATNFAVTDAEGAILMALVEVEAGARPETAAVAPARPAFEVGRVYDRRRDVHARYGGQQQGGISTPRHAPYVFLFSSPTGEQYGYHDGWTDDGVYLYTGEGQAGDMEFVRGNQAVRDHAAEGRDLYLFESPGNRDGCRYVGQFHCAGWETRVAPDTAGSPRRVIVFHLLPEGDAKAVEPVAQGKTQAPDTAVPLEELRRRALSAVSPGERPPREARRTYYERSAAVRDYVLARAGGVCEACRRPAPFCRPGGTPYLEPHHIRRLSDGGPDHPRWVGAVCPACHAEVHHGEHGALIGAWRITWVRSSPMRRGSGQRS